MILHRPRAYATVCALAIAGYALLPLDTWLQTAWQVGVGVIAVTAIVAGVRRGRPAAAGAWLWFAAGIALNGTGVLAEAFIARVLHIDAWPTVASLFYQALYPAFAIGLALLIRRRTERRDWGVLIDVATVSVGLGLLSWVFLIHPTIADGSIPLLERLDSIGPAVGDLVLLAIFARLVLGAGHRTPALRLVAASLGLFLAGDLAWALVNQLGLEPGVLARHGLDMAFLAAYATVGAAALHPSIREDQRASRAARVQVSRPLLALLTVVSLIAPGILAFQVAHHRFTDGFAIVGGCVALFLLVIARMALMLRHIESQAARLRELTRIDELTGLPNRRAWNTELPRAIERARRDGDALAVAMLDLDAFKRFNDDHGHLAGDQVLKASGAAWRESLRAVDVLARYGGEEFAVLLPAVDAGAAAEVLERLRAGTPAGMTVSVGLAAWDGRETAEELLARADRALYTAKRDGRDCLRAALS
jgi:diguanylate cyclase (GGDEF)-like protein